MTQTTAPAIERLRVPIPNGFEPDRHADALLKKVAEKAGSGWELSHLDTTAGVAVLTRMAVIAEMQAATDAKSFSVKLPKSTRPTDGDKMSARLEDEHPGYYLTNFEPFLGRATLTKMDDDSVRCRGAAASALGVKPWDVQVSPRRGGGFDLKLPKTYMPSKHDSKLEEVATGVVGQYGWVLRTDPARLTASMLPGEPPTFPPAIPAPLERLGRQEWGKTAFGHILPPPGGEDGRELIIDWSASAFGLVAGLPGGGKDIADSQLVPVPACEKFPTGWARHGELAVGDQVYAVDGSPTTVEWVSPEWNHDIYEVTFSDGQTVRCGAEHLWTVSTRRTRSLGFAQLQGKYAATDERRRAEIEQIERVEADAVRAGRVGGTTTQLAHLLDLDLNTVRSFAKKAGIPHLVGAGSGQPRIYPIDEFARAWREHRLGSGAFDTQRSPLTKTMSTAEILGTIRVEDDRLNFAVPTAAAVDGTDLDLPISPYIFGAWIGDGISRQGAITVGRADLDAMFEILAAEWPTVQPVDEGHAATLRFGRPLPGLCVRGHEADWVEVPRHSPYCRTCRTSGANDPRINLSLGERLADLGVKGNKRVPAAYLRASRPQRLALLQGIMDTDGTIRPSGGCELTLSNEGLARSAMELIRSLGIKAVMSRSAAGYRRGGQRRRTKDRFRIKFTTTEQVFRLPRKAARLPQELRKTSRWNYITGVHKIDSETSHCITIRHSSHQYLVGEFIPTHNSVSLNAIIASALGQGSELVICDIPAKSVDFSWCKDLVRPGGWGCDSAAQAVTALALAYEEGERRAKVLGQKGYQNWLDMPEKERFTPITIIVDELTGLTGTDKMPAGIPKDHPLAMKVAERNLMANAISSLIYDIISQQRFVGMRVVLSTQVTNNNTGVSPSLKALIGHRVLCGSNPSKPQRDQAFNDASSVPEVPEHIKSAGKVAKGVGSADLEGEAPCIFKSFFAPVDDYRQALLKLKVPTTSRPEPTAAEIAKHTPSLDDTGFDTPEPRVLGERTPSGKPLDPKFGPDPELAALSGFEKANATRSALAGKKPGAAKAKTQAKEDAEWAARSGEVTVTKRPTCPDCGEPISPTGDCGCQW